MNEMAQFDTLNLWPKWLKTMHTLKVSIHVLPYHWELTPNRPTPIFWNCPKKLIPGPALQFRQHRNVQLTTGWLKESYKRKLVEELVVIYSWTASPFCWSLRGNLISPKPTFTINSNSQHWLLLTEKTVFNKRYGNRILTFSIRFSLSFPRHARGYRVHWQRLSEKNGFCYICSRCTQCKPWPTMLHPGHF